MFVCGRGCVHAVCVCWGRCARIVCGGWPCVCKSGVGVCMPCLCCVGVGGVHTVCV